MRIIDKSPRCRILAGHHVREQVEGESASLCVMLKAPRCNLGRGESGKVYQSLRPLCTG